MTPVTDSVVSAWAAMWSQSSARLFAYPERAARKISRTDIFEVLFGSDAEANRIAHDCFNECYRNHYGHVEPFEPGTRDMLVALRGRGIRLGVLSNRDREFLDREIATIDDNHWTELFDTVVGGDDADRRKPAPDPL